MPRLAKRNSKHAAGEVYTPTFNVHEAKTRFSQLLWRVQSGEEVIIARDGKPVARLVRIEPEKTKKRPMGICRGQIWMAPDWDAPMTDEELAEWGID